MDDTEAGYVSPQDARDLLGEVSIELVAVVNTAAYLIARIADTLGGNPDAAGVEVHEGVTPDDGSDTRPDSPDTD